MKPEDFELFAVIVKQRSGLILAQDKAYLLEQRLVPVARKHNLKMLEDVAQAIRSKREEQLMLDITEAMTTNETCFFRNQKPFAFFQKKILPYLLTSRAEKKQIRIWSAATSSGQEAYSLAMICAEEAAKLQGWKVEIIGTDISREMVTRAKSGIYSQFEVQLGLPIAYLIKYFHQIAGGKWQIKDAIRQMVQFREGNLVADKGVSGTFDVVFCRNALPYFDAPTQAHVLTSIGEVIADDGCLVTGKGEAVSGLPEKFKPLTGAQDIYIGPSFNAAAL